MTNKTYDILKRIAQIWIPAMATLYFALAQIWCLPYGEEIIGTLSAIDVFLGAILGISKASYAGDGSIGVQATEDGTAQWALKMDIDANTILNKDYITLKVRGVENPVIAPTNPKSE